MKNYRYKYLVNFIGDDTEEAYEAIIPKFPTMHVFGDSLEDLHQAVMETIECAIEKRKKNGLPIPPEDIKTNCNGKILIRIDPELHYKLSLEAQARETSLNSYIQNTLAKAVSKR